MSRGSAALMPPLWRLLLTLLRLAKSRPLGGCSLALRLRALILPKQEKGVRLDTVKPPRESGRFLYYLTKLIESVVDQLSPGARMAAAGFSSHLRLLPSREGRLCQGSMHTN